MFLFLPRYPGKFWEPLRAWQFVREPYEENFQRLSLDRSFLGYLYHPPSINVL